MQHLEVSCAVRRFFKSLGFKGLTSTPDGSGQFHAPAVIASSDHQTKRWVGPRADLGTRKTKVSSWNRTQGRRPGTAVTILSYAGSYLYVESPIKQMIIRKKMEPNG